MNPEIINNDRPVKRKRSGGGRAYHSRLELFAGFIRKQRQQRRTWQEIASVSGQSKPARDGRIKTSHFEGRIALERPMPHKDAMNNST